MSNPFYTKTGNPLTQSRGLSSQIRNEFLLVEQGFDAVTDSPAFTGAPTVPTANGSNLQQIANMQAVLDASLSGSVPTQAGNTGKYLKTDGTNLLWGDVVPVGSVFGLMATSDTVTIDGSLFLKSGLAVHPSEVPNWPAWATQPNGAFGTVTTGAPSAVRGIATSGSTGVWVLASANTVRRSSDHGATWSPVAGGFTNTLRAIEYGNGVFIGGTDAGAVLRSTDGGTTWGAVTSGFSASYAVYALATDGAGVWVGGNSNGDMRRSTNDGAAWSAVTSGYSAMQAIDKIAFGNGVWLAIGYGGTRRSTDGGETWNAVATGLSSTSSSAVATDGAGRWIIGGTSGAMKVSTDNGATFSSVTSGTSSSITALATDGLGNWWLGSFSDGLRVSTDNGATWNAVAHGFGTYPVYAIKSYEGIVTIAAGGSASPIMQRHRYAIGIDTAVANQYLRIA